MHLGNLLLSLYHAAKTKRWQNLKFWKSSNKIYLKVVVAADGAIKDNRNADMLHWIGLLAAAQVITRMKAMRRKQREMLVNLSTQRLFFVYI